MTNPPRHDPANRFSGLSTLYARCRPGYPASVVDCIMSRCGRGHDSLLADVGCGTGISSGPLAARGVPVPGIEPNADVRARAGAEPPAPGSLPPLYLEGRAE